MKTLFIHTDTTGLWQWKLPSTASTQPHMVRVAMIETDDESGLYPCVEIILPRPGWRFEPGAVEQHNITKDYATRKGIDLLVVMHAIDRAFTKADRVVAYNSDFHRHVLERSAAEVGMSWLWPKDLWVCAMRAATPIVKVPRMLPGGGYSFPKLVVAYLHFTGHILSTPADPIEGGIAMIRAVEAIQKGIERTTTGAKDSPKPTATLGGSLE